MDNRIKVQEQIKSMKKEMKECEYKHFKGNTYIVTDIAVHSETEEPMAIYRSAADPEMVWCRPLDMFLSEVDHEKYPDVKQTMRFEKIVESGQEEDKEDKKYGIVLRQKYDIDGLIKKDILELADRLDDQEVYPIEIEAKQCPCSAMGFITAEAAEILDYDYEGSGLRDFIAAILDNVDLESADCQYEFKGIDIWIDYGRS